jgi:hypothetical protein
VSSGAVYVLTVEAPSFKDFRTGIIIVDIDNLNAGRDISWAPRRSHRGRSGTAVFLHRG